MSNDNSAPETEGAEPYTCGTCGEALPETPIESCHHCGDGFAEARGDERRPS